ncbi:hypothetical protein RSOLAG1IB_00093 [Rhizoctonia solani AG-1 IB]|uniref:NAD(P)-binding protein n=1 Tax=Thanatephorus cucumeris (strain AG1-IB / isolate 7/3/14) TaxID=1108050 RepID=A0A0B7F5W0_THACB|nr:hypothetical protein RSOLAG1IB_00093 [Rhizoctonia solani AG-1 IB]
MGSAFSQTFPPKPVFSVEQIPDLTGQVIIVTGGNAGVGRETCKAKKAILNRYVAGKNRGVMMPPVEQRTANGYDLQFGTNVLGHYFFSTLLLPTLIHTAKNSPLAHGHARVINTSSSAVYFAPKGGIAWETLGIDTSSTAACRKLGTSTLYAQSKLGNVLFSNELAKRYADQGIISSSLNPGNLQTDLQRHVPWPLLKIMNLFLYPASYGALTQLWSGTSPDGESHSGKFLIPWARVGDAGPNSHDEKLAEKLWSWLEEQAKGH